jgi:hypothetical protein
MRWPCARKNASGRVRTDSPLGAADAAEALDWDAFSRRYFPGRKRHDAEARSAYAAYKQGRGWRTPPASLSLVPTDGVSAAEDHEREEAGTRRLMAEIALLPDRGIGARVGARSSPTPGRPVNLSALKRRAVESFDHAGLFMVPLDRPRAIPADTKRVEHRAMRSRWGRATPTKRHKSGLHRYCSSCAGETEHVLSGRDGRGSIPLIRWPAAEPASGTTICLECGHWRATSFRPNPPAWSEWPRTPIAPRRLGGTVGTADSARDLFSEEAAENEGMPPKREPSLRRRSTRLRRLRAVARPAQMKGS